MIATRRSLLAAPVALALAEIAEAKPKRKKRVHTEGSSPLPKPTCPQAVHDAYVTTGPDGQTYPTWGPQIDQDAGCYARHDHGADPKTFHRDYRLPFGYAGARRGMSEDHVGYKVIVFDGVDSPYRWLISMHFGTHSVGGVCNPFHEVVVALLDTRPTNSGSLASKLLADTRAVRDFGPALWNSEHNPPMIPERCQDQADQARARGTPPGVKRAFPIAGKGYEPWVPWMGRGVVPFTGNYLIVNTWDPMMACDEVGQPGGPYCDFVPNVGTGTGIFFQGGAFGFDLRAYNGPVGRFWTDPMGLEIRQQGDADAVEQFISPRLVGRRITTGANRAESLGEPGDRWTACACTQQGAQPAVREGSIRLPADGVVVDPN